MVKKDRETAIDEAILLDGNYLTVEQLDGASLEMLQDYSDNGLRFFSEQCRHCQAMAEIELEGRKSEGASSARSN
jgi:hypothetical protein